MSKNNNAQSVSEVEQWEQLLEAEGLGMNRGRNTNKIVYGYKPGLSIDMKLDQVENWIPQARKKQQPTKPLLVPHCGVCGKTFIAKRKDARFCSWSCRVKNAACSNR